MGKLAHLYTIKQNHNFTSFRGIRQVTEVLQKNYHPTADWVPTSSSPCAITYLVMVTRWSGCAVLGLTASSNLSNVDTNKDEPLSRMAVMKLSCLSNPVEIIFKLSNAASSKSVLPKNNMKGERQKNNKKKSL